MAGLEKDFLRDLGIKALALVMALAVYVHVFSGQEREMVYRVPLLIDPLPSGLVLEGETPAEARIRIRATGKDLLKLRTRRFHAEVKLDAPRAGPLQRPLLGSDVRLPRGIKPALVEVLEPQMLHLQIEPAATAMLPVAPRLRGELPVDRALVRMPIPDPRQVRVTGPRSVIASLDSVSTTPVSTEGWHGDIERTVEVMTPSGVTAEPKRVRLLIELEEKRVRESRRVPVEVNLPRGARLVAVQPESAFAVMEGAVSVVQGSELDGLHIVTTVRPTGGRAQYIPLRAVVPRLPADSPARIRCVPESASVIYR